MVKKTLTRILILAGTREAGQLAEKLFSYEHFKVITSLAGRTQRPAALAGVVRRGGFGNQVGLQNFLRDNAIDILIDATHPFATQISLNAVVAANTMQCRYYRFCRPPWTLQKGEVWINANDYSHAAAQLTARDMVFLTIGRQHLAPFIERRDVHMIARMIEAPIAPLPEHIKIMRARPPYSLSDERKILTHHRINVLVTKNSGGSAAIAKLTAAREMSIPIIMIRRPSGQPPVDATTVDDMLALLRQEVV